MSCIKNLRIENIILYLFHVEVQLNDRKKTKLSQKNMSHSNRKSNKKELRRLIIQDFLNHPENSRI